MTGYLKVGDKESLRNKISLLETYTYKEFEILIRYFIIIIIIIKSYTAGF